MSGLRNTLRDPLISTDCERHTLPGLLASMARGEVTSFPALRPHQRPAWHMFLVQLATLALRNAGQEALPDSAGTWAEALLGLTPDHRETAWALVAEDPKAPAFLQPPDPGGLKWTEVATPDALDMVITSRNHDLKQAVAKDAAPEDWLFALVSLQTMEGYGGAGNNGIARMNGGSSSRAMLGLAPDRGGRVSPSAWWARDVARLLRREGPGLRGHGLLWTLPWPEGRGLRFDMLDPLFIEVCRRVRLRVDSAGRFVALRSTSKAARVQAKELKGMTGDPWAPVHRTDNKALTLGEDDFTYRRLSNLLLSGDWAVPDLAVAGPDDTGPMMLVAEAFSRGNSKTDGFRSRAVPVPEAVASYGLWSRAAPVAETQMKDIAKVDTALRDGLAMKAARGNRDKLGKAAYAHTASARAMLQDFADRTFFEALWPQLAPGPGDRLWELRLAYAQLLSKRAAAIFDTALPVIPCPAVLRPKAENRARRVFWGRLAAIEQDITKDEKELADVQ